MIQACAAEMQYNKPSTSSKELHMTPSEFQAQQTAVIRNQAKHEQQTAQQLRELADKVAIACNAPEAGVGVTVVYVPPGGYQFHIWNIARRGLNVHSLWASCTNEARLLAHVSGFISNVTQ